MSYVCTFMHVCMMYVYTGKLKIVLAFFLYTHVNFYTISLVKLKCPTGTITTCIYVRVWVVVYTGTVPGTCTGRCVLYTHFTYVLLSVCPKQKPRSCNLSPPAILPLEFQFFFSSIEKFKLYGTGVYLHTYCNCGKSL